MKQRQEREENAKSMESVSVSLVNNMNDPIQFPSTYRVTSAFISGFLLRID